MIKIISKQDAAEKTKWLRQQLEEYKARHPEIVSDLDLKSNLFKDFPGKNKEFMDVLESVEKFFEEKDLLKKNTQ